MLRKKQHFTIGNNLIVEANHSYLNLIIEANHSYLPAIIVRLLAIKLIVFGWKKNPLYQKSFKCGKGYKIFRLIF
jgi:hypothetical protein